MLRDRWGIDREGAQPGRNGGRTARRSEALREEAPGMVLASVQIEMRHRLCRGLGIQAATDSGEGARGRTLVEDGGIERGLGDLVADNSRITGG